jgi:hypothetical protein
MRLVLAMDQRGTPSLQGLTLLLCQGVGATGRPGKRQGGISKPASPVV